MSLALIATIAIALSFSDLHLDDAASKLKPHVGIIDLKGEIFDGQLASADNLNKSLRTAYETKGLQAIILRIDSPGGSPVQADYMFNTIRHYRQLHPDVKYYAVCMDSCTSAAYYLAAAADEIYASPASLVGSIGVIYNGFGFVDAMQKFGISRRLHTAGVNKGFMDQFSAEDPAQIKQLQVMLDLIHQQFIQQVKLGRGSRLSHDPSVFSGMVWTGSQAKELGLVDGLASPGQVMRDIIKLDSAVDYTEKHSVFDQFAKNLGTELLSKLPQAFGLQSRIE